MYLWQYTLIEDVEFEIIEPCTQSFQMASVLKTQYVAANNTLNVSLRIHQTILKDHICQLYLAEDQDHGGWLAGVFVFCFIYLKKDNSQ
jgi:hypothetical protein